MGGFLAANLNLRSNLWFAIKKYEIHARPGWRSRYRRESWPLWELHGDLVICCKFRGQIIIHISGKQGSCWRSSIFGPGWGMPKFMWRLWAQSDLGSNGSLSQKQDCFCLGLQVCSIISTCRLTLLCLFVDPRLEKAPVILSGGMKDDSTGAHSFLFLRRRGTVSSNCCSWCFPKLLAVIYGLWWVDRVHLCLNG